MKADERQEFVKKALLGLWAMFTLILVVALGLVVVTMVQQGRSPFPAPAVTRAPGAQAPADPQALSQELRETRLYFASEDGRLLEPESRRLTLGDDTIANCHAALDALIAGPDGVLTPVVPPATRVRGIFFMGNGEMIVDLSMETVAGLRKMGSVSTEMLFLQGIVHTLTAPELAGTDDFTVTKVRFLIEGAPADETFKDAHCTWAYALPRDSQWLGGSSPAGL
ncbi:MAG TPA: GerMN domain-containing protein [Candidatus Hydrogenedentes bacterium]|jgi:spore germination protein GerM|nr:GerMN domain-containing protein [Candidatus Hydrogenedentota bacterium]HPJ99811.1 GerMN domain-containing protein [Candidatus Hydrogenedentota bacterium]